MSCVWFFQIPFNVHIHCYRRVFLRSVRIITIHNQEYCREGAIEELPEDATQRAPKMELFGVGYFRYRGTSSLLGASTTRPLCIDIEKYSTKVAYQSSFMLMSSSSLVCYKYWPTTTQKGFAAV